MITTCSLLRQMALLRTLVSDTEENRMLLTAVTAVRVGRELHNQLTCQDKIDAYKVDYLQCTGGTVECNLFHVVGEFLPGFLLNNCLCLCPSPARLCSEHRAVPPDSPESLAGWHQCWSGEKGPALCCTCKSFGNGSTVLNEPEISNINLRHIILC